MWRGKAVKPVPIRPHHGMCLAYFQGSGYSEGFTKHMQEMLELFERDVPVKLTVAADEICSACPNNQGGICSEQKLVEAYDNGVLEKCRLEDGAEMSFLKFAGYVQKEIITPGYRADICGECQWDELCRGRKSRWEKL